jgi:hypothetical protein
MASQPDRNAPQNGSSYVLQSSVMGAAGAPVSGSGKEANGTLGQSTPLGVGSSTNFTVHPGFWRAYRVIVSVIDQLVPEVFSNALFQNFPNPFNPSTTIRFTVAAESPVELLIFNVQGQKVRTLVNEGKSAGSYRVVWDGRNENGRLVASGVYFYRLRVGGYMSVKKMLMLK